MVLSHRSLDDDELFQIKIDKLEGDVATTDLLNVGVVEIKAGDAAQHWTLMSSHLLYRGEKLQQFNQLDLEELKVIVNHLQTTKRANQNCLMQSNT